MKYPKNFAEDLQYLVKSEGWTEEDKIVIRAAFKYSLEMVKYLSTLAAARRVGYVQNAENGFMTLIDFCVSLGLGDYRQPDFYPQALNEIAVLQILKEWK